MISFQRNYYTVKWKGKIRVTLEWKIWQTPPQWAKVTSTVISHANSLFSWCDVIKFALCSPPPNLQPWENGWEKCQTFPNEGYSKIYLPGTFQDHQHHQREYRKSVIAKGNQRRHDIEMSYGNLDRILEYKKYKAKKIKEGINYGINWGINYGF